MASPDNPTDAEAEKFIHELADELDEYVPDPECDISKPFLMPIGDVEQSLAKGLSVAESQGPASTN